MDPNELPVLPIELWYMILTEACDDDLVTTYNVSQVSTLWEDIATEITPSEWSCETLGEQLCATAARYGQLETLQQLREEGAEWNERVCELAAMFGYLHILQWARNNGGPWDEYVCECADLHTDVLQWIHENGCPCECNS